MAVIKRSKENSVNDLVDAVGKFAEALATQGEGDAIKDLELAVEVIKSSAPGSGVFKKAIEDIREAYEEHELEAYTMKPKKEGEWGPVEHLYVTSTQVLSILKRFGVQ